MEEKPSIKIIYDAFQYNIGVEDFNEIETFKKQISKDYTSFVKAIPTGRGGGAYQFIVDFIINLNAKDYFKIISVYLASKALDKIIDPILDRYIFVPLKNAYKELKKVNPILDCYQLKIEFLDTKIYIYSVYNDSLIENIDKILQELYTHFSDLIINEFGDEFPSEIHIPLLFHQFLEFQIYRPPLGMEESIIAKKEDFYKLWGLKYQYTHNSKIYDLINNCFIDGEFMTEKEFYDFANSKLGL
ncbi:MAG: hypothetical protein WCL51_13515 [Bacteroidota bacterium]